jgi:hypothetical protein
MDLILKTDDLMFSISPGLQEQKEMLLAEVGAIGRVRSVEENERACALAGRLHELESAIEKARVILTKPLLEKQRELKKLATDFSSDISSEKSRLNTECGNFQTLEKAKLRDAEVAHRKALDEIERQHHADLASARNHEEREAIVEQFNNRVAAINPPIQPTRAEGQVVKDDWDFDVVDVWALCRAFPNCIKPEPIRTEIKRMLDAGHKLPGVNAKKVTKSGVRLSPQQKLIEVG